MKMSPKSDFRVVHIFDFETLLEEINAHEKSKCVKQSTYSTYHRAMTCVDFSCGLIFTNIYKDVS